MLKLLWNMCNKTDSLWVKWVHSYYVKRHNIMDLQIKASSTWILRSIMKLRDFIHDNQARWADMTMRKKFQCRVVYQAILVSPIMPWCKLLLNNLATPRATIILWLVCHIKLATKSRLFKFGMVDNNTCVLCNSEEILSHLFFFNVMN